MILKNVSMLVDVLTMEIIDKRINFCFFSPCATNLLLVSIWLTKPFSVNYVVPGCGGGNY